MTACPGCSQYGENCHCVERAEAMAAAAMDPQPPTLEEIIAKVRHFHGPGNSIEALIAAAESMQQERDSYREKWESVRDTCGQLSRSWDDVQPTIESLRSQLAATEADRDELRADLASEYRCICRAIADIANLRYQLERAEAERDSARAEIRVHERRCAEFEAERDAARAALDWEDVDDEWTESIKAAHPTRSGAHKEYATAMRMVGHRHSKGELVSLVTWLLRRSTQGQK